jgi:hypothetical protein
VNPGLPFLSCHIQLLHHRNPTGVASKHPACDCLRLESPPPHWYESPSPLVQMPHRLPVSTHESYRPSQHSASGFVSDVNLVMSPSAQIPAIAVYSTQGKGPVSSDLSVHSLLYLQGPHDPWGNHLSDFFPSLHPWLQPHHPVCLWGFMLTAAHSLSPAISCPTPSRLCWSVTFSLSPVLIAFPKVHHPWILQNPTLLCVLF